MSACYQHLIGKVFKRGGGAYPGYWIVVSITPRGDCVCLGVSSENSDIVRACNYQPYYVDKKETVAMIDVSEIRFQNETSQTDTSSGDGQTQAFSLSSLLSSQPSFNGSSDRDR